MGKNTKLSPAAIVVAMILIIVFLVGCVAQLTRLDEVDKTFYVEYDGEEIARVNGFEVNIGETVRFDVGYKWAWIKETGTYHVKIVPKITGETSFEYRVEDEAKYYSDIPALTNAFNVVMEEDYFTLRADGDLPVIISKLYPFNKVTGIPSTAGSGIDYFTLYVYSEEEAEEVRIDFRLSSKVSGITLDPGGIIF